MDLQSAKDLAAEVVQRLRPCCRRIEIAGSIRRQRPVCHDVDIVLVPGNQGLLAVQLLHLGKKVKSGPAMHEAFYCGHQVDIYIANEITWATKLLIRTGSKDHNIRLCARAKELGMQLHADGSGLTWLKRAGQIVPAEESHVFEILGLPFKRPEERL